MVATDQLKSLRDKAHQQMEAAMKAGHIDGVIKYARIIKEADEALNASKLVVERIAAQMESDGSVPVATPVLHAPARSPTSNLISRKARGNACRDEYLRGLLSRGINLSRVKGKRIFQDSSGRRVGIAYASEDGNKWWMGLPDEHYDVVILLCQTSSGETLDFVLPPTFVHRVWGGFSLSQNGQREWHVVRSGPNYELDPKRQLGQINPYLSRLEPLR
jgi:hypothetical protein